MPRTLEGQITMEKTPSYFITKEAPRRVFSMSRHTKLIVVVRDPVTRAVSDYTQTLSKSPGLPSFQNLAFRNATTGLIDTSWSAVRIGIYAKHLENWLRYFPLSSFLFVSGERLVTDPAGEMGRVQDFLGLKRVVTDKHFYFNQTKGFPCLKKPEGSSRPRCLGKSKGRPHPQIPSGVLLRLRDFYRPFNLKFYQMTSHNFGWDWTSTHQSSQKLWVEFLFSQLSRPHRDILKTLCITKVFTVQNRYFLHFPSFECRLCQHIRLTSPRSVWQSLLELQSKQKQVRSTGCGSYCGSVTGSSLKTGTSSTWQRENQKYAKLLLLSKTFNSTMSVLKITPERSQCCKGDVPQVKPNGIRVMSLDSQAKLR